jgi:hypothetical protein
VDLEISPGDAQQHSLLASSLQQRGVTMPTASAGSLADKVIAAASASLTSAKRSRGQSSSAVPQPDGKRGRTATATKAASQKGAQRNGAFSEAFKDFAVRFVARSRNNALCRAHTTLLRCRCLRCWCCRAACLRPCLRRLAT